MSYSIAVLCLRYQLACKVTKNIWNIQRFSPENETYRAFRHKKRLIYPLNTSQSRHHTATTPRPHGDHRERAGTEWGAKLRCDRLPNCLVIASGLDRDCFGNGSVKSGKRFDYISVFNPVAGCRRLSAF